MSELNQDQATAFGFAGKNELWKQILIVLEAMQERETLIAIGRDTLGENRIHASGRADGITDAIATLRYYRQEARKLSGLNPEEDVV